MQAGRLERDHWRGPQVTATKREPITTTKTHRCGYGVGKAVRKKKQSAQSNDGTLVWTLARSFACDVHACACSCRKTTTQQSCKVQAQFVVIHHIGGGIGMLGHFDQASIGPRLRRKPQLKICTSLVQTCEALQPGSPMSTSPTSLPSSNVHPCCFSKQ